MNLLKWIDNYISVIATPDCLFISVLISFIDQCFYQFKIKCCDQHCTSCFFVIMFIRQLQVYTLFEFINLINIVKEQFYCSQWYIELKIIWTNILIQSILKLSSHTLTIQTCHEWTTQIGYEAIIENMMKVQCCEGFYLILHSGSQQENQI